MVNDALLPTSELFYSKALWRCEAPWSFAGRFSKINRYLTFRVQLVIDAVSWFQNSFPSPHKTTSRSTITETMRSHLLTMLCPLVIKDVLEYKTPGIKGQPRWSTKLFSENTWADFLLPFHRKIKFAISGPCKVLSSINTLLLSRKTETKLKTIVIQYFYKIEQKNFPLAPCSVVCALWTF